MAERESVLPGLAGGQNSADAANLAKFEKQVDIFTADCSPEGVTKLLNTLTKLKAKSEATRKLREIKIQ